MIKESTISTMDDWDITFEELKLCYGWCLFLLHQNPKLSDGNYVISPEFLTLKTHKAVTSVKPMIMQLTYPNRKKESFLELSYYRCIHNREISEEGQMIGEGGESQDQMSEVVKRICDASDFANGFLFLREDLLKCEKKLEKFYNEALAKQSII